VSLPPLIVIAGATATGKTGLSLALADAIRGAEIISADSRQVYRGMDIGTAKVGAADRARLPHHGLDLVDPDQPFSAADYRRHALTTLGEIAERGGTAILVGGTGLYLDVVAKGIPVDETGSDDEARAAIEQRLSQDGLPALVAELRSVAPSVAGSIDLANPRRVVRALERAAIHGDRQPPRPRGYPAPLKWLGLEPSPQDHARWISERATWQLENGLLDEAASLRERYPENLRAFSAVGYREAFDVLAGRSSPEDARDRIADRTRRYAKRQRTWFRANAQIEWHMPGALNVDDVAHRFAPARTYS
jgi:tRNA dimethylallyltransferase